LGACCLPGGNCSRETESSCALRNGRYRGDGTSCAAGACSTAAPVSGAPGLIILTGALGLIAFVQLLRKRALRG
jgi:hypothetical protein